MSENNELDIVDFTAINGVGVYYKLVEHLKREPTQYEFDMEIEVEYEQYLEKKSISDPEKVENITRIEVIGISGREFSKKLNNSFYEVSIQDDGRTIKLFEKE